MATTLKDIASELNISPTLVSRVLNDKPGAWASVTTRSRILETAERLNYRPSSAARALVTGKSMLLAVSAADADWHRARSGRVAEMVGLVDAAADQQYRVLVLPSPGARAQLGEMERLVSSNGCDGFCLYAEQAGPEIYHYLQKKNVPFVVIGNPGPLEVPRVDHNNAALVRDSVAWLAAQGRRRIALLSPPLVPLDPTDTLPPEDESTPPPFSVVQAKAFEAAMKEFCGGLDPLLGGNRDWTDATMAEWLDRARPEALILRGLASALQWKLALQRLGGQLAEDLVLMAQINPTELLYLRQSRLDQGMACHVHNPQAVGYKAGELLIQWINGETISHEPVFVASEAPRWC